MSAGDHSSKDEPVLRWTVHPAAHDRARAVLVLAVVALAGLLAFVLSQSALLAAAGTFLLLASLRAFFLPRTYVLDARGAREEGPLATARTLPWSDVRVVTRVRNGVHLAPLYVEPRWRADRGLFLRTHGNAERVAAFALARTPPQGPA